MRGAGSDLVREGRRRRGLTQAQLADLAGTTQSAIARLEAGRTSPSFDDVIRYLRLMDLDLDVMLVDYDDSDWRQASALLELTPQERTARFERFLKRSAAFRGTGAA